MTEAGTTTPPSDPPSTPPIAPPPVEPVVEPAVTPPVEPVVAKPVEPATEPPVEPPVEPPTEPPPVEDPIITKIEDFKVPDGVPQELLERAVEKKYTQKMLEDEMGFLSGVQKKQQDKSNKFLMEQGKKFMESWGEEKDSNLAQAQRAVEFLNKEMGQDKLKNWLKMGPANHPVMIETLLHVGKILSEGSYVPSGVHRPIKGKSLEEKMFPSLFKNQ